MSKDSRIGESLWFIWDDEESLLSDKGSIVFYTEDHVDIEHEIVRKALASSIQREGISQSLSDGFFLIASGVCNQSYIGYSSLSEKQYICNKDGLSEIEDNLTNITPITYVEIFNVK